MFWRQKDLPDSQHLCTKLMVSHPHDCNHETKPIFYVIMTYKTKERYQYILYNASYSRCTKTEFIREQNSGTAQYTHAKFQLAGTCVAAAHASGFHEISQDTHNAPTMQQASLAACAPNCSVVLWCSSHHLK